MRRRPVFSRAARALLDRTVDITGLRTSGSMGGTETTSKGKVISALRVCIQPRSAWEQDTVLGKYTDATHMLFCDARDSQRVKLDIRKGYTVQETYGTGADRRYEVTDDPENYDDVFLAVPLRPVRL